jgi:hypothetical protein
MCAAGACGAEVPLVPIPNTTVKLRSGDDTRKGKVAQCRIMEKTRRNAGLFLFDQQV